LRSIRMADDARLSAMRIDLNQSKTSGQLTQVKLRRLKGRSNR
jgi:hypothetical protein